MSAAKEIRKLTKRIKEIGAMFDCPCCGESLALSPPEHILDMMEEYFQNRIDEQIIEEGKLN